MSEQQAGVSTATSPAGADGGLTANVVVVTANVVVVTAPELSPWRPQPANSNAAIDTARTPARVFAMCAS